MFVAGQQQSTDITGNDSESEASEHASLSFSVLNDYNNSLNLDITDEVMSTVVGDDENGRNDDPEIEFKWNFSDASQSQTEAEAIGCVKEELPKGDDFFDAEKRIKSLTELKVRRFSAMNVPAILCGVGLAFIGLVLLFEFFHLYAVDTNELKIKALEESLTKSDNELKKVLKLNAEAMQKVSEQFDREKRELITEKKVIGRRLNEAEARIKQFLDNKTVAIDEEVTKPVLINEEAQLSKSIQQDAIAFAVKELKKFAIIQIARGFGEMITIIAKWIAEGVTQIASELGEAIMGIVKMLKGIGNMIVGEIDGGFNEMRAGILECIVAIAKIAVQIGKMYADFLCIYSFCLCISAVFFYLVFFFYGVAPHPHPKDINAPLLLAFFAFTIVSLFLKWWMV